MWWGLTPLIARSDPIVLQEEWMDVSVVMDHQQRSVLFYMDGKLVGKDWFDMNLIDLDLLSSSPLVSVGGYIQEEGQYWMEGVAIDQIVLYTQYNLHPDLVSRLTYPDDRYCNWRYEWMTEENYCISQASFPHHPCPSDQEYDHELASCVPVCQGLSACLCDPNEFAIWSVPTSSLTLHMRSNGLDAFHWFPVSEIRVLDRWGEPLSISTCQWAGNSTSSCLSLFDGDFSVAEQSFAEISSLIVCNASPCWRSLGLITRNGE